MQINRRRALAALGAGAVAPAASVSDAKAGPVAVSFQHGVASGDPAADSLLLWTRVTPASSPSGLKVQWELAEDAAFKRVIARDLAETGPGRDYTVKAVAGGLAPGRDYFYRFTCEGARSPTGRARTLPGAGAGDVVLAVVSCSLYPNGYFNVYDQVAKLERVDAAVHLGDYIYEYGAADSDYGMANGKRLGRIPEPPHEIVTLDDYRTRHALYKRDPDLQAAHARCAWICVWDDHEVSNDDWMGGAENHQPAKDGPWLAREAAAVRAYYEWMPIRDPEPGRAFEAINRSFPFGDLVRLIMVESRLVGRSRQLEYGREGDVPTALYDVTGVEPRKVSDPTVVNPALAALKAGKPLPEGLVLGPDKEALQTIIANEERLMLGPRQEQWLSQEIAAAVQEGCTWQVLGNQVVMARTVGPNVVKAFGSEVVQQAIAAAPEPYRAGLARQAYLYSFDVPYDLDGWDAYPAARERVYDAIKAHEANAIVISGDSHAFWANELRDARGTLVAAEFGASSVTSPTDGDYAPGMDLGKVFMDQNPEVIYCSQNDKGFILLTLTRDKATAEMFSVETLAKPYGASLLARFEVSPQAGPGLGRVRKV
ncbi:MAG: alkaline phosphatase D family protein [Caulobacteraceae bacterium]